MKRRRLIQLAALSLSPLRSAEGAGDASSKRIAVVVSPDTKVSNVSIGTLRRIFLSQATALEGQRVVPFNQPRNTLARQAFDRRVLGMTPQQSARYWVDQRIRGASRPPRSIANPQLLLRVAAQFPGAIAYLEEGDLSDAVKLLRVSGVPLSDDRYPIRG